MSIIGRVGRQSFKVRALNASLHIILLLGSVTMVYPFLLMISSSFKSAVDSTRLDLVPRYVYRDGALYQKYLESRYNEESSRLMDNYPGGWIAFSEVELPSDANPTVYEDWKRFLRERGGDYGVSFYYVSEHYGRGVYPLAQRQYRKLLREENGGDLAAFNRRYNTGAKSWEEISVEEKDIFLRNFASSTQGYLGRFRRFKEQRPDWQRLYMNPDGTFVNAILIPTFQGNLDKLNKELGTNYAAWSQIILPESCPARGDPLRPYWLEYAREVLSIQHLRLSPEAEPGFRRALKEKYGGISLLNTAWQASYSSFEQVGIPVRLPDSGAQVDDLALYIQTRAAPEELRIVSVAAGFRNWLEDKYGSLGALNRAWGSSYAGFGKVPFPSAEIDRGTFLERKGAIRREFLTRNYAMALDQMLADARSLRNTLIYVLLSIFFAVTVNPLAAYALSRFKPRFTHQVIMIFMLTMAFPAMVMGIPNFLMLKRLNLLNTFWALVLPAAADGYFIFLLKGFFDSLPREIYESASLDGAGELRMFWQFTMYLSKPILAVIALGAFNAAYRNFLFAFLVCQDQSMWTLMVHIYELLQRASSGVGYAALVIAAIPTLAVFVFFQNIIIRGIVVPMEK